LLALLLILLKFDLLQESVNVLPALNITRLEADSRSELHLIRNFLSTNHFTSPILCLNRERLICGLIGQTVVLQKPDFVVG
jgi:hypothetical protein